MNEEELKLLEKLDELPKELNIQIRGLLLNEVFLRKENERFKIMIKTLIDNKVEKLEGAKEIKIPHICKYTLILNMYQRWLEKEKSVTYRDCGYTQNAMIKCYDKLKELRERYEVEHEQRIYPN